MNDTDRSQWIDNDEGLYNWWKSTKLSKRDFIRAHRAELDSIIDSITKGRNQAHYLAYGPQAGQYPS